MNPETFEHTPFDVKAIDTTRTSLSSLSDVLQVRTLKNPAQDCTDYLALRKHRHAYYAISAPHLLAPQEQEIERNVDMRSVVYTVSAGPVILSSLRLTPRPFELEQFKLHIDFTQFNNYLEIGRLVTNPNLDPLTSALIVRFLLCGAGLGAIEEQNCQGLAAICRPFRLSFFNKFGLKNHFSFFSEQRQLEYHFLTAPMATVLSYTEGLQENETALRRRLSRLSLEDLR